MSRSGMARYSVVRMDGGVRRLYRPVVGGGGSRHACRKTAAHDANWTAPYGAHAAFNLSGDRDG